MVTFTPQITTNHFLVRQLQEEYDSLMNQRGSYPELHNLFLIFFEKLRTQSNCNPNLKTSTEFSQIYQGVLNVFDRLHMLQMKVDKVAYEKMMGSFKAVLSKTTNPQQIIPPVVSCEDKNKEPLQGTVIELQKAISLLKEERPQAVESASAILKSLHQKKSSCIFAISGMEPMLTVSRIFFHLYNIHAIESPNLLKDDKDYGFKAFLGTYPGFTATNTQRCRALQRTLVELVLADLEKSVNFEDVESTKTFLKILEGTQLQNHDSINGVNIAHLLFGSLYQLHTEARKSDPTLIDPNHAQFNGDFGRNAFQTLINELEKKLKLQTIIKVHNDLKTLWQIS